MATHEADQPAVPEEDAPLEPLLDTLKDLLFGIHVFLFDNLGPLGEAYLATVSGLSRLYHMFYRYLWFRVVFGAFAFWIKATMVDGEKLLKSITEAACIVGFAMVSP